MNKTFFYFAYGSDMSLPQMRGRMLDAELTLEDDARKPATLQGYRLAFDRAIPQHDRIGHANLHPADGSTAEGVVYELPQEALAVLDRFEGVAQGLSRRIEVQVQGGQGALTAYAYVAGPDWEKEGLTPSRNHLYRLLSAQRLLSPPYFAALKEIDSLKVAVDDEGMPHSVKKKLKEMAQAKAPVVKPAIAKPATMGKSTKSAKPVKARESEDSEVGEKKKFYPAVGAYAPKSARAFRKAFGIPEKKESTDAPKPRKPSPWAGRDGGRDDSRRDDSRREGNRNDKPRSGSAWAGRGERKDSGGYGKKPGKGRPW